MDGRSGKAQCTKNRPVHTVNSLFTRLNTITHEHTCLYKCKKCTCITKTIICKLHLHRLSTTIPRWAGDMHTHPHNTALTQQVPSPKQSKISYMKVLMVSQYVQPLPSAPLPQASLQLAHYKFCGSRRSLWE